MYELKNGARRLARALKDNVINESEINMLAHILNYDTKQLKEDIAAINEYVKHEIL